MKQKTSRHAANVAAADETRAGSDSVFARQYSTRSRSTSIRSNNLIVATVRDGVLYKTIHFSRHLLHKPRAIAFDVAMLEAAERAGATIVEIRDAESGGIYRASLARIRARGLRFDRGHGPQFALVLGEWNLDDEQHDRDEHAAQQLALW